MRCVPAQLGRDQPSESGLAAGLHRTRTVIAHKPNLIVTARKMLYALEVMRGAIEKRRPRDYREAMVMVDTFDVIVTETVRECADDMAPA
jgi:hypothetical protein